VNGPAVEVCDLGDWGSAALLAEYDARDDAIRINVRAVEAVRAALGKAAAAQFVACAVAHERFHRDHPGATEAAAHGAAGAACGTDPRRFEAALRLLGKRVGAGP
jgi:hypothetical protein